MKKLLANILCIFIPNSRLRKKVRQKIINRKLSQITITNFLENNYGIGLCPNKHYTKLSNSEWAEKHKHCYDEAVELIKTNKYINPWTYEIEKLTNIGESVIEIGCAVGVSSLYLSKKGRKVCGLDYSEEMCIAFQNSAEKLNLTVKSVCADITKALPIDSESFDTVWHAGVIEHFTNDEVQFITNECARIAKKKVISMCPNANSIAYRIGKDYHEKLGLWHAGEENPKYTLKDVFLKSGLQNIYEYTIGFDFALEFLPDGILKNSLQEIYINMPLEDKCHQGYLLITVGEK